MIFEWLINFHVIFFNKSCYFFMILFPHVVLFKKLFTHDIKNDSRDFFPRVHLIPPVIFMLYLFWHAIFKKLFTHDFKKRFTCDLFNDSFIFTCDFSMSHVLFYMIRLFSCVMLLKNDSRDPFNNTFIPMLF